MRILTAWGILLGAEQGNQEDVVMAKRKGFDTKDVAAQAKAGAAEEGGLTTAIIITPEQYAVLRAVAQLRAPRQGGVTSVCAVIRELVDKNIDELRAEAKPLLDIG